MAAETGKPIQFYFDFISPFGYFASLRIDEVARRHGREAEWTSMLVGVSVLFEAARAEGDPAALLRRNVDDSIWRGVFGSPFFIVDGEPFFGLEKLPVVEEWLATGGW